MNKSLNLFTIYTSLFHPLGILSKCTLVNCNPTINYVEMLSHLTSKKHSYHSERDIKSCHQKVSEGQIGDE